MGRDSWKNPRYGSHVLYSLRFHSLSLRFLQSHLVDRWIGIRVSYMVLCSRKKMWGGLYMVEGECGGLQMLTVISSSPRLIHHLDLLPNCWGWDSVGEHNTAANETDQKTVSPRERYWREASQAQQWLSAKQIAVSLLVFFKHHAWQILPEFQREETNKLPYCYQ